jgi:uncharacterized protein involved in type VI secretion and phage assembly
MSNRQRSKSTRARVARASRSRRRSSELISNGYAQSVATALVTQNKDDKGLCRVKVRYPWHDSPTESYWARLATPMAGKERGMVLIPEVGDEVLVGFERGDLRFPYVIGALWNAKDKPPLANSDGKIASYDPSGHQTTR